MNSAASFRLPASGFWVGKQLAGLREPLAEVLMLRYFEDLSHKDIAEVLDLPESTVQSRLLAGRRELHRKMNEEIS